MNNHKLIIFRPPYVSALSILFILGMFIFLNELIPFVFKAISIALLISTLILGYLDEIVVSHSNIIIKNILRFTKNNIPLSRIETVSVYKGLAPSTGFVFTINYVMENKQNKKKFEVHYQSEKVINFLVFLLKHNITIETGYSYEAKLYLNEARKISRSSTT